MVESVRRVPARPADAAAGEALENVYVFGHRGFLQTVPAPPSTWTRRPAAVVLVSANGVPVDVELKGGERVSGRVVVLSSMVERRLAAENQALLSFNVQPVHASFADFRALRPTGALALRPEPFAPLADACSAAFRGALSVAQAEDLFEQVIAGVQVQLPPAGTPDARLAAVLAHLHEQPRAGAAELGQRIGRSGDWVSRTFSNDLGISLRDYLAWLKQRTLLHTLFTRRSITALALDAGFAGASDFASAYQRWYGRTPTASRDPRKVRLFVAGPQ